MSTDEKDQEVQNQEEMEEAHEKMASLVSHYYRTLSNKRLPADLCRAMVLEYHNLMWGKVFEPSDASMSSTDFMRSLLN